MNIFSVFSLLGGLALFLYGMNVMGSGLEKVAGGRFERILEKLTSNPIRAVLLGAGVTAVIQSSSATTVMVVGFVNSGIMKLSQAIGIIMGANLGTTITSWLLSLTGIEGTSFFMQLLKPSGFSPILAFVGIVIIMTSKNHKKADVGSILVGFAILMFGMETMSDAVKPLANVPEFTNILLLFSNPVFGVLVGALLTAVIQSSSASVGILQALSATGKITFGSAIPIILGQNIGTCVTAMLSSIGANKNARRAALVHLYFNIIGTVLFLILFYSLHGVLKFTFIENTVNAFDIAVVHTIFNLVTTVLLLPFAKVLEKLSYLTIKEDHDKEHFHLLDERFLQSPSFAIEQCRNVTIQMANLSKDTILESLDLMKGYNEKEAQLVIDNEKKVDKYEDKIGSFLVKLSATDLSQKDSTSMSLLLHAIGDFERISDHAVNIQEVAKEIKNKGMAFSDKATEELSVLCNAVKEILNIATRAFNDNSLAYAYMVEPLEEVIDNLRTELKNRHIRRLQEGRCTIEMGFVFSDLLTNLERVSDHCSNIAVCVIQASEDSFNSHKYLNNLKHTDGSFKHKFEEYSSKYQLP